MKKIKVDDRYEQLERLPFHLKSSLLGLDVTSCIDAGMTEEEREDDSAVWKADLLLEYLFILRDTKLFDVIEVFSPYAFKLDGESYVGWINLFDCDSDIKNPKYKTWRNMYFYMQKDARTYTDYFDFLMNTLNGEFVDSDEYEKIEKLVHDKCWKECL